MSHGNLLLGLTGLDYYIGFSPFLNWWKIGRYIEIESSISGVVSGINVWNAGIYLDPTSGEILTPAPNDLVSLTRIFYALPGAGNIQAGYDTNGLEWTIKWDGTATVTIGGLSNEVIDNEAGVGTFTFGSGQGNVWATFTITDPDDPPRNIRIYQTRYESNVDAGEIFNPDWLAEVRHFNTLRMMGWWLTNDADMEDFDEIAVDSHLKWGGSQGNGPKYGVPLSVICALAEETGCNIHFCIPHKATDACVQSIAEYFQANLPSNVFLIVELSNEPWNFQFEQAAYFLDAGVALFGMAGDRFSRQYGYRAAQVINIFRDVYGEDSGGRWRGCLGTQTVSAEVTNDVLAGINYWRENVLEPANSLSISNLFTYLAVTGYFGLNTPGRQLTSVTNDNPGVATRASHGYANGERLRFFVATGMTELDEQIVTVANVTTDTFELQGIDTTAFGSWENTNANYVARSPIFDLMDDSESANIADSETYPTKYTLFNQVCAQGWRQGDVTWTGEIGGTLNFGGYAVYVEDWLDQKVITDANGLLLMQYEGGCHFIPSDAMQANGGNPRFNEFMFEMGYSEDIGEIYRETQSMFLLLGGVLPAKFVEGGLASQFGVWAGMRFIPGDEDNPVWQATKLCNSGAVGTHQIRLTGQMA